MQAKNIFQGVSAGFIGGIYGAIFAISIGVLLFSGPLSPFIGYGISIALVTTAVGSLAGFFSDDSRFIAVPDVSMVVLITASMTAISSLDIPLNSKLNLSLQVIFLTSVVSALLFYSLAKMEFGEFTRYIPFPVIAGYLAALGWLGISSGVKLIAGVELTVQGIVDFYSSPNLYQLGLTVVGVGILFQFRNKVAISILVPIMLLCITLLVHLVYHLDLCHSSLCSSEAIMFTDIESIGYFSPWELSISLNDLSHLIPLLPSIFIIAITSAITNLLLLVSYETIFKKEFDPNQTLVTISTLTTISGLLGGSVPKLSPTRSALHQILEAKPYSGIIAAGIAVIVLFEFDGALTLIPKAAMGCICIYLGINTVKQWTWDTRKTVSKIELAQIIFIVVLVAKFDYIVGFVAGIGIAFIAFIVTYSRLPLIKFASNLSIQQSSTIRSENETVILKHHGHRVGIYKLSGYIFFGSAKKIEKLFSELAGMDFIRIIIIDFSHVEGIDHSAINSIQRILHRLQFESVHFYFVFPPHLKDRASEILSDPSLSTHCRDFASFDHALEAAEEVILNDTKIPHDDRIDISSLFKSAELTIFKTFCTLRTVKKDESICEEGTFSEELFFIVDGTFEVNKKIGSNTIRLAKILADGSAPMIVGEIAFYTHANRTATITASSEGLIYILTKKAFQELHQSYPTIAEKIDNLIISKLAEKLLRTSKLIETLS